MKMYSLDTEFIELKFAVKFSALFMWLKNLNFIEFLLLLGLLNNLDTLIDNHYRKYWQQKEWTEKCFYAFY